MSIFTLIMPNVTEKEDTSKDDKCKDTCMVNSCCSTKFGLLISWTVSEKPRFAERRRGDDHMYLTAQLPSTGVRAVL